MTADLRSTEGARTQAFPGPCHGPPYTAEELEPQTAEDPPPPPPRPTWRRVISPADWTEAELLEFMALAAGDRADGDAREAYRVFYERHEPWLRAMIRTRRLGKLVDWDEGRKDAVQLTFQRAYDGAGTFRLGNLAGCDGESAAQKVRAWLGGIATNVIADILRAQGMEVPLYEDRPDTPSTPLELLDPDDPLAGRPGACG